MSQPYGQQPPGNYNQGQQPGYGGMPPAPPEYTGGPTARPGSVTAAAVLAFVQAGITVICSIVVMIGAAAATSVANDETIGGIDVGGTAALLWIMAIAGLAGAGLLIWGGVKAMSGTAGQLLVIAAALQIVLCIVWLVLGAGFIPILLVVMPIITLVMALGSASKQYEASRR
jgi:hypothetical protein